MSKRHEVGTTPSFDTRPDRGSQPRDPAEARRYPDRAGRIGAERPRHEIGGHRGTAAAARATAHALGRPGVAGGTEVRAGRQGTEGELVRVQLPHDHRAGGAQERDRLGVPAGEVVAKDLGRRRRPRPCDVDHVLDCDRHTAQRTGGRRVGLRERLLRAYRDECVERRRSLDSLERRLYRLAR